MENLLILYPDKLAPVVDEAALVERLREIGFIADTFDFNDATHYKPGEEFLYLLTFLGCSPVVSLGEPGKTGDEFCHIAFSRSDDPLFLSGRNVKPTRCPNCGQRETNWKEAVNDWSANPNGYLWQCPKCQRQYPLPELKWRQCAGFGRYFIKVWGIYEGEAVPGEQLMNELERATDTRWRYFYLQKG